MGIMVCTRVHVFCIIVDTLMIIFRGDNFPLKLDTHRVPILLGWGEFPTCRYMGLNGVFHPHVTHGP